MAPRYSITLLCALAVFTIGSGIGGVTVAADRSAPVAEVYAALAADAGQRSSLPVLPTVYVTASPPALSPVAVPPRSGRSVMLDRAVGQAGSLFARGTRRVGLAMPYYAFGTSSRRTE